MNHPSPTQKAYQRPLKRLAPPQVAHRAVKMIRPKVLNPAIGGVHWSVTGRCSGLKQLVHYLTQGRDETLSLL